jgi:hypothetical protein
MLVVGLLLVVLGACSVAGDAEQETAVAAGCGGWSSNATVRTVCCAGQPGTTGVSTNTRYVHYAGFLGAAFIQPGVTNADGTPLEADPDNDDDGLTDTAEVSGSAFDGHASTDPNKADTDEDGMDDAAEAAGMYDPHDPHHLLVIVSFTNDEGNVTLTWIGKGGNTINAILSSDDLVSDDFSDIVHSDAYTGGDDPWYKTTNTHVWVESGTTSRYYQVTTK